MDEFGLVWLSLVWFDEVDFLKCPGSASQLSFTNLFSIIKKYCRDQPNPSMGVQRSWTCTMYINVDNIDVEFQP